MRKVHLPRTLAELWSLMEDEPEANVYAGGTDLLAQIRRSGEEVPALICLERMTELQGVRQDISGWWLGACTTHSRLLDEPLIKAHFPVLAKAVETLGSPPIRNMGTIGGNICTASPAGDCLPPLYALDAAVELRSRDTVRSMPIAAFITGPGQTQLKRGEILAGIRLRKPEGFTVHRFEKVGQRKAMAIAIASMAALLKISSSGMIEAACLAWGSVAPTVVRSAEVEEALVGRRLSAAALEEAAALARQAAAPIDDLRATADYRRTVTGNLLFRLAEGAVLKP